MKVLITFFLFPFCVFGQSTIGLPSLLNFNNQAFNGGLQTWDIKQDKSGILYFANNEGLITFNGKYWSTYALPNKTIVRSVEINEYEHKVYVGGEDEIGYFLPSLSGHLKYISLINDLPKKYNHFGDVWDIVNLNNCIFFRTDKYIFKYCNNAFEVFESNTNWLFLGIANNKVYAQERNNGLLVYENNVWHQANLIPKNASAITGLMWFKPNQIIACTLKDGIYCFDYNTNTLTTPNKTFWADEQIYCAQKIDDYSFAAGSPRSGLYITDLLGITKQKISKKEGLQNDNILSILADNTGNLWLGLNNGIDFINYQSAIKIINPFLQNVAGYAALLHEKNLYLGTSNNLYAVKLDSLGDIGLTKANYNIIANSKGQNWGLTTINNKVLLSHQEGAFVVENDVAKSLSSETGYWNFIPSSSIAPTPTIIGGNYNGLSFFNYTNNSFTSVGKISNFKESSRYLSIDNDKNIWVSHPYHGIFKISKYSNLNTLATVEKFDTKKGLPSDVNNHVFIIKNEVIAATPNGLYYYNSKSNKFQIQPKYFEVLGNLSVRYLKEDTQGNIWYISDKRLGVLDVSSPKIANIVIEELNRKILSGFENIYPINSSNIIISGEVGFYLLNFDKYKQVLQKPTVGIRRVTLLSTKDSLLYGGFPYYNEEKKAFETNVPSLSYGWKSLKFQFSSTNTFNHASLKYSYRLKGFDNNWSEWSYVTEKEYTNLDEGTYEFEVKVKNSLDVESPISAYTFKVLAPWYKTKLMLLLYAIVIAYSIYFLYKKQKAKFELQQQKHDEEQRKIKYIYDLELKKTEADIIVLKNEKLTQEIEFKNAELASSALHLVQKREIITSVRNTLMHLSKGINNTATTNEIKKLLKRLGEDEVIDNEWDSFSKHFNTVHKDFLSKLINKYPNLTSADLKLSAYLYMNLSSKEIAQLLNISLRGVEISRYRLRKKLGLPTEINLVHFLMDL